MSPAARARETTIPSEGEVHRMLAACSERAPSGVRNRALIALLYSAGPRVEELLALGPADLDLDCRRLRIGGRRARVLPLFAAVLPYLETWLWWRSERTAGGPMPANAPLFCTLAGAPLEPAYLRAMLARTARRAGLRGRVHAHGLRHACAVRLAAAGVGEEALSGHLGLARRGAARALAPLGVRIGPAACRSVGEVPWTLAPEPGTVRALVRGVLGDTIEPWTGDGILVVPWVPDEL
jgi:integrase/recombinase XerD